MTTASGALVVPTVYSMGGGRRELEHMERAHSAAAHEALLAAARERMNAGQL
ncbi:hypothetical protein [Pseudoclavibacter helvolus]|uniref:hypothetical protein n=1 Tax=Pseudoclavibacter helvolus TaxID=255205 RepID=UPI0012E8FE21|nr:hypothetical protein [Pseudoclavibacter helvolus]